MSNKKPMDLVLWVLLSVMLGLMCALFTVIASNILFILWNWLTGIPDTGSSGEIILDVQRLSLILVFAALAGIISTKNLNMTRNDVIVAGAVAGASMAILLFLPLLLLARYPFSTHHLLYMSLPPYLISPNVFDYAGTFSENMGTILVEVLLALPIMFILSTAVAAGAAYLVAFDSKGRQQKTLDKPAMALAVLVLIVMLLPTAATATAIWAGVLAHPTNINYQSTMIIYGDENSINVAGGNKTLNFELLASPGLRYLDPDHPFTVLIDGKDASNQRAAAASVLQVTIDPPGGLTSIAPSHLKIKGILPKSNVEIIANFQDGVRKPVLLA